MAAFTPSPLQLDDRLFRGDRGGSAGTCQAVYALPSAPSQDVLVERAVRVTSGHEILRTAVVRLPSSGALAQVVGDSLPAVPVFEHLVARGDPDTPAMRVLLEGFRGAVGREHPPLWRVDVLRDPARTFLAVTADAACLDLESLGLLAAHLVGTGPLAAPTVQYADASEWLASLVAAEGLWRDWQATLDRIGATPLPDIGIHAGRGSSYAGVPTGDIRLPMRLLRDVEERAGWKVTSVLAALWTGLLGRLGNAAEIPLRFMVSGRERWDLARHLGPYAQARPVLMPVERSLTLAQLAGRLESVLEDVRATPEPVPPQYQVAANADERAAWSNLAGLLVVSECPGSPELMRATGPIPGCALGVVAHIGEEAVHCDIVYDDVACVPQLASLMAERFAAFARRWLEEPDRRLDELDPFADGERATIARLLEPPPPELPTSPVPTLILERAREAGPHPAVIWGGQALSYVDLVARARALALRLVEEGVRPGDSVVLMGRRCAAQIVGLLGIQMAGAAYVPVAADYPPDRIQLILGDAGADLAVVGGEWPVPAGRGARRTIMLAADGILEGPAPGQADLPVLQLSDPAYIIYTSGSTGRPNGVVVTHGNLAVSTDARLRFYGTPPAKFLLLPSIAFDSSVAGIFWTLAAGGTLVIPEDGPAMDIAAIVSLLRASSATEVLALPSLYAAILEHADPIALSSLRRAIVAGEECPPWLPPLHADRVPEATLWNEYGPTETTVWCTAYRVRSGHTGPVPIGLPVPSYRAYVVDSALAAVPIGVPGELIVGGPGVAAGYLGRPDLTRERFLQDHGADLPGARMYRTGDRVRLSPLGVLEFLGRGDDQVKIRGYRIELGEIEMRLRGHAAVDDCVAAAWTSGDRDTRLVAYVVFQAGAPPPGAGELRAHLGATLPEFMVPALIVPLERLPRTPNGKVDRQALPDPREAGTMAPEQGYQAPQGQVEEVIARTWATLLGLPRVGRHDNFFELGGHSLLALRVAAQLQREGVDIAASSFFTASTVSALARAARVSETSGGIPRRRQALARPTDQQLGLWFLEQLSGATASYNLGAACLVEGDLDVPRLEQALGAVIKRQSTLRSRLPVDRSGLPVLDITPFTGFHLELEDLQHLAAGNRRAEVMRIAAQECGTAFSLGTGPLYRFRVLRLSPGEHVLVMTIHHAVFDGWSFGLLLQELAAVYTALAAGEAARLPDLPIAYEDYAEWQRGTLEGPRLAGLVSAWTENLHGAAMLCLPTDRPRPARPGGRGGTRPLGLTPTVTKRLHAFAASSGVSRFSVLMALYRVLLHSYSGQADLVIGASLAGRGRDELQSLMGYFVNTLPFRVSLAGNPTFREVVRREVRAGAAVDALQDLPFARLVRELQLSGGDGGNPVFTAAFNLLHPDYMPVAIGTADGGWSGARRPFADLALTPLEVPVTTATLDLVLNIMDGADTLQGSMEYDADLFDTATIDAMIARFLSIMEVALGAPDSELSVLSRSGGANPDGPAAAPGPGRAVPTVSDEPE